MREFIYRIWDIKQKKYIMTVVGNIHQNSKLLNNK